MRVRQPSKGHPMGPGAIDPAPEYRCHAKPPGTSQMVNNRGKRKERAKRRKRKSHEAWLAAPRNNISNRRLLAKWVLITDREGRKKSESYK